MSTEATRTPVVKTGRIVSITTGVPTLDEIARSEMRKEKKSAAFLEVALGWQREAIAKRKALQAPPPDPSTQAVIAKNLRAIDSAATRAKNPWADVGDDMSAHVAGKQVSKSAREDERDKAIADGLKGLLVPGPVAGATPSPSKNPWQNVQDLAETVKTSTPAPLPPGAWPNDLAANVASSRR